MRHKKVISLYDVDPEHSKILDYLEGFEGRNRQSNALMQLILVGHRVLVGLESGEEAYFRVRNPDVRKLKSTSARPPASLAPKRESSHRPPLPTAVVVEDADEISVAPGAVASQRPQNETSRQLQAFSESNIDDLDGAEDPLMKLQRLLGE